MSALSNALGAVLRIVYETLQGFGMEPKLVSNYAISLIIMSVLIKLITMPLTFKSTKNAQRGAELNPQVEAIRKKYARDPGQMNQKIMQLYKDNNYSPTSGCLPMIISLVIIFAMFGVVREPAKYLFDNSAQIHDIAKNFLWVPDLSQPDPFLYGLPLIYAVTMIAYSSMMQQPATDEKMQSMNVMMKYMMPAMMFFFSRSWAAGLLLYWAANNIVELIIRLLMKVFIKKKEGTVQ